MFLSQIKKLKELQEQHAFALAAVKQQGGQFEDEQEKLVALAIFDLNLKITNAVHDYAEAVGDDNTAISVSIALLAGAAGALCGFIGQTDEQGGQNCLRIAQNYQQSEYEKYNGK